VLEREVRGQAFPRARERVYDLGVLVRRHRGTMFAAFEVD
jgi:hypothetical protein